MDEKTLRLKRHYSIIAHSPDDVELRYGVWNATSFTLADETKSGRLVRLITRLDGSLTPAQLSHEENVPREDVEALIDHLLSLGVLEPEASNSLDHYLDDIVPWRVDSHAHGDRRIIVLGDGELAASIHGYLRTSLPETDVAVAAHDDPTWRALTDSNTSWIDDGLLFEEKLLAFEAWRNALLVFVSKIINPVQLRLLNRICLAHRIPWLHAAIDGPFLFIGPIFIPRRSACYECLETRIIMNLRESASYQRYKLAIADRQVRFGQLPLEPVTSGILASLASLETMNYALTGSSSTVSKMMALYLPTMEFTYNEVLRLPGCTGCSPSPERDDQQLYFDMGVLIN